MYHQTLSLWSQFQQCVNVEGWYRVVDIWHCPIQSLTILPGSDIRKCDDFAVLYIHIFMENLSLYLHLGTVQNVVKNEKRWRRSTSTIYIYLYLRYCNVILVQATTLQWFASIPPVRIAFYFWQASLLVQYYTELALEFIPSFNKHLIAWLIQSIIHWLHTIPILPKLQLTKKILLDCMGTITKTYKKKP